MNRRSRRLRKLARRQALLMPPAPYANWDDWCKAFSQTMGAMAEGLSTAAETISDYVRQVGELPINNDAVYKILSARNAELDRIAEGLYEAIGTGKPIYRRCVDDSSQA